MELQENEQSEWTILSSMHPRNPFHLDEINILAHRDLDVNYNWDTSVFTPEQKLMSSTFIDENHFTFKFPRTPMINTFDGLSTNQQKTFDIVKSYVTTNCLH